MKKVIPSVLFILLVTAGKVVAESAPVAAMWECVAIQIVELDDGQSAPDLIAVGVKSACTDAILTAASDENSDGAKLLTLSDRKRLLEERLYEVTIEQVLRNRKSANKEAPLSIEGDGSGNVLGMIGATENELISAFKMKAESEEGEVSFYSASSRPLKIASLAKSQKYLGKVFRVRVIDRKMSTLAECERRVKTRFEENGMRVAKEGPELAKEYGKEDVDYFATADGSRPNLVATGYCVRGDDYSSYILFVDKLIGQEEFVSEVKLGDNP